MKFRFSLRGYKWGSLVYCVNRVEAKDFRQLYFCLFRCGKDVFEVLFSSFYGLLFFCQTCLLFIELMIFVRFYCCLKFGSGVIFWIIWSGVYEIGEGVSVCFDWRRLYLFFFGVEYANDCKYIDTYIYGYQSGFQRLGKERSEVVFILVNKLSYRESENFEQ